MGNRVKGGKGYLQIDNRASGGTLQEYNTLTCGHCNCITVLNPERKRARGYCQKCHAYTCDAAVCRVDCNPIQQGLELILKYPGLNALARGKQGEILFDPSLKVKLY